MKALVDPTATVTHIVSWSGQKPIIETYPNSARIAEVSANPFDVALPLFWVDCLDNVIADGFWYDTVANQINPVEDAQQPPLVQPTTDLPTL